MEKKNLPSSSNSNPSSGGGGFMSGFVNSFMGSKNKKVANPKPVMP